MRVLIGDNYNVYIYPQDHVPPHCHIRYREGNAESIVGLPLLNLIAGIQIKKKIKRELLQNLEQLIEKWDNLNP